MAEARWTGSSAPYLESGQGDVWGKEAAAQGRSGTQQILSAGEVPAPQEVATRLHIEPGAPVVARQRLIQMDGQPIELANSYWPPGIASGTALAETGKVRGGAVSLLASLGYEPGAVAEEVGTRPPTKEEAQVLQLADNREWVLTLTRAITTPDGRPYEVSVMVSPGRIGRLHYSMKVD